MVIYLISLSGSWYGGCLQKQRKGGQNVENEFAEIVKASGVMEIRIFVFQWQY